MPEIQRVSGAVCQEPRTRIKSLVFVLLQLLSLLNAQWTPTAFRMTFRFYKMAQNLEMVLCCHLQPYSHALAHCPAHTGNNQYLAID